MSAIALVEDYLNGRNDPLKAVKESLDHCERDRNGSFLNLDRKGAIAAAELSQKRYSQGNPIGLWDGVPIGVKDNLALAGLPWTNGMLAYQDRMADFDASCLSDLKASGAVIIGKCHLHEAAMGTSSNNPWFGPCHHPRLYGFSPGGSSGGSAVAVASGLVPLALGTDTMGSVRIPAGCCGIFGYKPSPGKVSQHGLEILSEELDTVGLLAENLRDLVEYGSSLIGLSEKPAVVKMESIHVGILDESDLGECHPKVISAYFNAVSLLQSSGISTKKVPWEKNPSRLRKMGLALCEKEIYKKHGWLLQSNPDSVSPELTKLMKFGKELSAEELNSIKGKLKESVSNMKKYWSSVDVIMTPVTPCPTHSFDVSAPNHFADFTAPVNIMKRPAVAIPFSETEEGLPLGLHVIGHEGEDPQLLSMISTLVDALKPDHA